MTESIHPAASHHLPAFITAPGETDVLMVVMSVWLNATVTGFDVQTATDGLSGLAHIDREPPDLVVLDLNLPMLGGEAILNEVAASRHNLASGGGGRSPGTGTTIMRKFDGCRPGGYWQRRRDVLFNRYAATASAWAGLT